PPARAKAVPAGACWHDGRSSSVDAGTPRRAPATGHHRDARSSHSGQRARAGLPRRVSARLPRALYTDVRMSRTVVLACLIAAAPCPGAAQDAAAPIKPFTIHVPDSALRDLKTRLASARIPDPLQGADAWTYGTDTRYLQELVTYWRDAFDWRAQERRLNTLEQFTTTIDGLAIHFVHRRSRQPNAFPLLITHGWPGSFVEFTKIIGPLTDPAAHGGRADDAFDVVIPSIPGFAFSDKPRQAGFDP